MANAKDIADVNPNISILIIGDSGTHKTFFLGTVPGLYVFDFDRGMAINRGKDIEYDTFKDAPYGSNAYNPKKGIYQWGKAWPAFVNRINTIGADIDKGKWERPLGFDSLTTMSNSARSYVVSSANRQPEDGMRIQDWGMEMALLETVMDQLTTWPGIKIATAHIQRDVNTVMESVEYLPLVTGKLAGKLALYFDEVWYTKVAGKGEDKKFTLITESEGMYKQAKSRYGVPSGTEATWDAVKKYVVGE